MVVISVRLIRNRLVAQHQLPLVKPLSQTGMKRELFLIFQVIIHYHFHPKIGTIITVLHVQQLTRLTYLGRGRVPLSTGSSLFLLLPILRLVSMLWQKYNFCIAAEKQYDNVEKKARWAMNPWYVCLVLKLIWYMIDVMHSGTYALYESRDRAYMHIIDKGGSLWFYEIYCKLVMMYLYWYEFQMQLVGKLLLWSGRVTHTKAVHWHIQASEPKPPPHFPLQCNRRPNVYILLLDFTDQHWLVLAWQNSICEVTILDKI